MVSADHYRFCQWSLISAACADNQQSKIADQCWQKKLHRWSALTVSTISADQSWSLQRAQVTICPYLPLYMNYNTMYNNPQTQAVFITMYLYYNSVFINLVNYVTVTVFKKYPVWFGLFPHTPRPGGGCGLFTILSRLDQYSATIAFSFCFRPSFCFTGHLLCSCFTYRCCFPCHTVASSMNCFTRLQACTQNPAGNQNTLH